MSDLEDPDYIQDRFMADVKDHVLTIVRDDGVYRHLRFRKPESSIYWFELLTWPGALVFRGDMDGYGFSRLDDMFQFFRSSRPSSSINPDYWSEKVFTAGRHEVCQAYSEEKFLAALRNEVKEAAEEWPGLAEAVEEELFEEYFGADFSHEDSALQAVRDFKFTIPGATREQDRVFHFEDFWEWDRHGWQHSFLWACHAIAWGIAEYDRAKSEAKP